MFAQKEGLTVLAISFLVYKSIQPIRSRIDNSKSEFVKVNQTDFPNWKYLDNLWNEERYIFPNVEFRSFRDSSCLFSTKYSVSKNSKICFDKHQSKAWQLMIYPTLPLTTSANDYQSTLMVHVQIAMLSTRNELTGMF